MIIAIDESGDLGFNFDKGSSSRFLLAAVAFSSDVHANEANNLVDILRLEMGLSSSHEFHYAKNGPEIREKFLQKIDQMSFIWTAVCINKELLYSESFRNNDTLIKTTSKYLFNHLNDRLTNSILVYDKNGNASFYNSLQTYLKREFNQGDAKKIKKIRAEDSSKKNILQIADYVASVALKKVNGQSNEIEYYKKYLLKKRLKLQLWPKVN
ncbi:MAG: hypothetical protein OHK0017_08080 [Patescibacteria group bacterium]